MIERSRIVGAVLAVALSGVVGCADPFGPSGPDVTMTLDAPPPAVAARALRVAIGEQLTEVPAPLAGGPRAERSVHGPGFGTKLVQVTLVDAEGVTLAAAAFSQDFQRHNQHWIAALVGPRRPIGICVGTIAAASVRGSAVDTLFVMYRSLPDGAIC